MKLPMSCFKCIEEEIPYDGALSNVEFRDDGRYEFTCPKGHKSVTVLQQQKFELLFDIGAFALKDGYYREAVSSFSSALERFYEFVIKVIMLRSNIDTEATDNLWKKVSNQSERQLGAYMFLYLHEFREQPSVLSDSNVKFRNSVIHKGKIPSKEEALKYGQTILDLCRPIMSRLKIDYQEEVHKIVFFHIRSGRRPEDEGVSVSTMCINTILSLSNGEPSHDERSLEVAVSDLKKRV